MYFDDFECDLGLSNSFDILIEDELGQEIDITGSIDTSQFPTPTEIEVIEATGETPRLTGLPGHANRQRIDIIPEIAEEIETRRKAGKDVDVKAVSEQMLQSHKEVQAMAWFDKAKKDLEEAGLRIPRDPVKEGKGVTVIQSPGETGEFGDLARKDMVADIIKNITDTIVPRLKKIDKKLRLAAAQAQATDEHNILMEREMFRQKVINDLQWLSQILPPGHPVKTTIDRYS